MAKKKPKIEKPTIGVCGECANFTPYTDSFLDPQGLPIFGTCPHKLWKSLRGERGCDCFKTIPPCKK